jgi:hypothetical protein
MACKVSKGGFVVIVGGFSFVILNPIAGDCLAGILLPCLFLTVLIYSLTHCDETR